VTHEVTNQPPPLVDYNVYEADRPLAEAVRRGLDWGEVLVGVLRELGRLQRVRTAASAS